MRLPTLRCRASSALAAGALAAAVPVHGQSGADALARWGGVEVLKYTVVATFRGTAPVVIGNNGHADVTDRYEIEFRWNQYQAALVGDPVIRNFPASMENLRGPDRCDTPKVTGTYDLATVLSAAPGYSADLHLVIQRELAAAIAPVNCAGKTAPTPGEITEETVPLAIPGIAMWAMPADTASGMSAAGDALTVRDGNWTYVYTLGAG